MLSRVVAGSLVLLMVWTSLSVADPLVAPVVTPTVTPTVEPDQSPPGALRTDSTTTAPHGTLTSELASENGLVRPVSLAYLTTARRLLVANRDAGTLSTLEPDARQLLGHWRVPGAEQLSEMLVSGDEKWVLVCSRTQNTVWLLQREADHSFRVLQTVSVPEGPVGLTWVTPDKSSLVAVACLWGRTVEFLKVDPQAAPEARLVAERSVALTHSPRRLLAVQDGERVIAADAFGGLLSVIRTSTGQVERTRQLPGHNLNGLGLMPNGQRVIVAHQILNPVAETSRDGVFWGIVMSNSIRHLPLENFLSDERTILQEADIHFLGEPNHGAADPTAIALARYDTMLTTLGGTDQLAVGVHLDHSFDRIPVGRNPVAVVTDPTGELAYVANQFSDSVSIVEIKTRKMLAEISLADPARARELTLAEQGEILFHDGTLSLDGWYSCQSCHTYGHTIGLLNDNLGDGNYGAPKRIPSLLGVADTAPFLWSGKRTDLVEQSRKSVMTTMHGKEPALDQLQALAAYMETLAPPPRIAPQDITQVARGEQVFRNRGCNNCHPAPSFTSSGTYDVGLTDEHGRTEFNPPSLRGVRFRYPYFHDHRAKSLREVFLQHQHPEPAEWTDRELTELIAYLQSL